MLVAGAVPSNFWLTGRSLRCYMTKSIRSVGQGKCLTKCRRGPDRRIATRSQLGLNSDLKQLVPETQRSLVEVVELEGLEPKLLAKTSFEEGSTVLQVPEESWITLKTVKESNIGTVVDGLEPWLQLALLLVYEREKIESGQESPLAAYVQTLPKELGSPAFWNEQDLKSIEGTQLWQFSVTYRDFFAQRYKELMADVINKDQTLLTPDVVTFEAFCWGVGCVRARVHAPLEGDNIGLVPVADLVRHSRNPNVAWKLNTGNLLQGGTSLVLRSLGKILVGQDLRMDYGLGNLDNKVVLDHGVVDGSTSMAGYSLQLQLPEDDPLYDDKADILELEGIGNPVSFDLLPGEEPSPVLLAFLRLLNCSGADAFHMESIFRSDAWDHMLEPLSETNETMICETMIGGCEDALLPYKAIASVPSDDWNQQQYIVYQVCGAEKAALEWILEWFTERKRVAKKLEFYAERRLKSLKLLDEDGESTFEDMILGD